MPPLLNNFIYHMKLFESLLYQIAWAVISESSVLYHITWAATSDASLLYHLTLGIPFIVIAVVSVSTMGSHFQTIPVVSFQISQPFFLII